MPNSTDKNNKQTVATSPILGSDQYHHRLLAENMTDALLVTDLELNVSYFSPSSSSVLGLSEDEFQSLINGVPSDEKLVQVAGYLRATILGVDINTLGEDGLVAENLFLEHKMHGERIILELTCKLLRHEDGDALGYLLLVRDIAERHITERKLRQAATVFANNSDGILIVDANSNVMQMNAALEKISQYAFSEIHGKSPLGLLLSPESDRDITDIIAEQLKTNGGSWQGEGYGLKKDGDRYHANISINVLHNQQGRLQSVIVTIRDITDRKSREDRIRHLAYYDALTKLPNRTLFHDRLEHEMMRCERNGYFAALLFLDLDKFKAINDSLGHAAGDELLRVTAARLTENVRSEDTVARMSGDEFTIIIGGHHSREHVVSAASNVAQKVLKQLSEAFQLEGSEVFISVSIGVAIYPEDGMTSTMLLRNADTAMYFAKQAGKGMYQFYTPKMNAHSAEQLEFQDSLHRAVADQEFEVYYQPTYDYATQSLCGVESLLRWRQPDGSLVPPDDFLPMAEQTGLIMRIGEWLITKSLQQFSDWRDAGLPIQSIAINLSARQFGDGELVPLVRKLLKRYDIPPHCVEFELTENVLMSDIDMTTKVLRKLKSLGVKITIDDFGTGYFSLHYLKELPIDTLKIDGCFVQCLPGGPEEQRIIKVIVAMAEGFDLRIVAEGVETIEQSAFLEALGCSAAQGYLFAEPQPALEIEEFHRQSLGRKQSA